MKVTLFSSVDEMKVTLILDNLLWIVPIREGRLAMQKSKKQKTHQPLLTFLRSVLSITEQRKQKSTNHGPLTLRPNLVVIENGRAIKLREVTVGGS